MIPSLLAPSAADFALIVAAVIAAYTVFGCVGFGSALIAAPLLAHAMPVTRIVPLLALLDMTAALLTVLRSGPQAERAELGRLLPMMVGGSLVGAAVLLYTRPALLLPALGLFSVAYAAQALLRKPSTRQWSAAAAIPFGLVGGVFSALFGSGGFIYAIYLAGRIRSPQAIQVTQATLIGLSTLTRVVLFAAGGIYTDLSIPLLALLLAPGMLVGNALGRRLAQRLDRSQFVRAVHLTVLASGLVLLCRHFDLF